MILRPYQEECLSAIERQLQHVDSTLAVLATGLGKSVIGAGVIRAWDPDHRVLWLAHRDELIRQAADAIGRATGEPPAIEMGREFSDEASFCRGRVIVSSVQTLSRLKRLRRFTPADFGLVIIDEAHHAIAKSYRTILDYFRNGDLTAEPAIAGNPAVKVLGVTATPKRGDGLAMGQVFDTVAFEYGIAEAVDDAWLVPVRQRIVVVEDLKLTNVKEVAGDFSADELEAIMQAEPILHQVAVPTLDMAGDRPGLVFCAGVNHAMLQAAMLNRYRAGCAAWVSGDTPADERREVVQRYKAGAIQFLCNCGIFTEGFDAPATAIVVMARPTKSLSLYVQMLGRGTRVLPGVVEGLSSVKARKAAINDSGKPFMTALDFVGNAAEHAKDATITAADVLGGKYAAPVRAYAKKTLGEEDAPAAIEEALERADAELALLAEEEERRKAIRAQVSYTIRDVDTDAGPARETDAAPVEPATRKQIGKLYHLGVPWDEASRMSKRQAGAVIGKLVAKASAS